MASDRFLEGTGLLHDRQRALHARITEAIERLSAGRAAEQVEQLAHHAVRGEQWEKAVGYLRQAGVRAMARGANREAVAYLEQALTALGRLPDSRTMTELSIDTRIDLRNALQSLGDLTCMGDHVREAGVLARRLGDQHRLARVAIWQVIQCLYTGDYNEATNLAQEAVAIARSLADHSTEMLATRVLGQVHATRGEFTEAIACLDRIVSLEGDLRYERFGAPGIQAALAAAWLAEALSHLGRFDEAIQHAEAAVQIAEAANDPWSLFNGLFSLGVAHFRRGDLRRATAELERSLQVSRTWIAASIPIAAGALAATYALADRSRDALPLAVEAVEAFQRGPVHVRPALILWCAGLSYLSAGQIDEATRHAREALTLSRRLDARPAVANALRLVGDVTSAGDGGDAEVYYREALALATELDMRPLIAHCHLGLGKLYHSTEKRAQAQEHLTTATTMYRDMGMTYWLEKAEAEQKTRA
jgi:tetratricopeptide (TPR) repeat protein